MRIMLLTVISVAALFSGVQSSAADEGPWCATVSLGKGAIASDCHYRTFEECLPNVLAGNRGFCGRNPYWQGSSVPRKHRKRHVNRD
jgi:hypothetical protein